MAKQNIFQNIEPRMIRCKQSKIHADGMRRLKIPFADMDHITLYEFTQKRKKFIQELPD